MKKFVSMLLALVMALSLMPSAFAAETVSASDKFTDVPANAWYLDELNYAVANGYISGTSSTTFSPDATITRGQFVTILGRMLNVSTSGGSTKFADVDAGSWYAPYVAWAANNGYVNGTSSTTFSPEATITVEQMGVIISNYITKSGVELYDYTSFWAYTDASSISSWAVSSMEVMCEYNLLVTDGNGNVYPHKAVTRVEGTVSLVRLAKATGLGASINTDKPVVQTPAVAPVDTTDYGTEAYNKAVSVHDELWASGKINSSMSQKEKARVYYDWLLQHCVYDSAGLADETKQLEDAMASHDLSSIFDSFFGSSSEQSPHTAYSALIKGKAVCDGYTSAYNLFLALEGIVCDVESGPNHMWTSATLDGVLYHIDATYGDTTGQPNRYFGMTEADAWARFGYTSEADYVQSIMEAAGH